MWNLFIYLLVCQIYSFIYWSVKYIRIFTGLSNSHFMQFLTVNIGGVRYYKYTGLSQYYQYTGISQYYQHTGISRYYRYVVILPVYYRYITGISVSQYITILPVYRYIAILLISMLVYHDITSISQYYQ